MRQETQSVVTRLSGARGQRSWPRAPTRPGRSPSRLRSVIDSGTPLAPPTSEGADPWPRRRPLGKIKDAADLAVGTGQKVDRAAVGEAVAVAGIISAKLPGRKQLAGPTHAARPGPVADARKTEGDPVERDGRETPAKKSPAEKAAARGPGRETATRRQQPKETAAGRPRPRDRREEASARRPQRRRPERCTRARS